MSLDDTEPLWRQSAANEPDQRRGGNDEREGNRQQINREERCGRERHHRAIFEHSLADPQHRLEDDGDHRAFQPEQHARHQRGLAEPHVREAQRQNRQRPGRMKSPPATSPPGTPCISQPT